MRRSNTCKVQGARAPKTTRAPHFTLAIQPPHARCRWRSAHMIMMEPSRLLLHLHPEKLEVESQLTARCSRCPWRNRSSRWRATTTGGTRRWHPPCRVREGRRSRRRAREVARTAGRARRSVARPASKSRNRGRSRRTALRGNATRGTGAQRSRVSASLHICAGLAISPRMRRNVARSSRQLGARPAPEAAVLANVTMSAESYSVECGAHAERKKATHCAPASGVPTEWRRCHSKPPAATATALAVT